MTLTRRLTNKPLSTTVLTYEHLMGMQKRMKRVSSKRTYLVANDKNHKKVYWLSRYQNIHRLITHCTHRPKQFIVSGFTMVVST